MNNILSAISDDDSMGKVMPLKITLPELVFNELTTYAEMYGVSKSEIIKNILKDTMDKDDIWSKRLYFFKPRTDVYDVEQAKHLASAPKGTLLKIAAHSSDVPHFSNIYICNLLKVSGRSVFFQIPNFVPHTALTADGSNVSLDSGVLVAPTREQMNSGPYPVFHYIYQVDISYVWAIDNTAHNNTWGQ